MVISMVIFVGAAWSTPVSKRLYHVITTLILTFAALSYFAMVSPWTNIREQYLLV